ncbi:MAG: hypothetical protein ABWY04_12990, partial [Arthrobacter sp.]
NPLSTAPQLPFWRGKRAVAEQTMGCEGARASARPAQVGVPRQETSRLDVELEPGSVFRLGVLGAGVPGPGFAEETVIEVGYDAGGGGISQPNLRLDRSRTSLDLSVDADEKSGP